MSASLSRCYLDPEAWVEGPVLLSEREAHHLIHVLRIQQGDSLICFDGQGRVAQAQVEGISRKQVTLTLSSSRMEAPSPWSITLAAAVPGHGKIGQIVDQATQLGVSRLIPLTTARGVVRLNSSQAQKRQERFNQIAQEAGKQCGLNWLPMIDSVTPWDACLKTFGDFDLVLLCAVEGPHESLMQRVDSRSVQKILLLVGPEGDFTPEETQAALKAGAHPVTLAPTVLRCETAAIAIVAQLLLVLQERMKKKSP